MSSALETTEWSPVTRIPLDDGARGRRVATTTSQPARLAAVASAIPHGPPPTTATVNCPTADGLSTASVALGGTARPPAGVHDAPGQDGHHGPRRIRAKSYDRRYLDPREERGRRVPVAPRRRDEFVDGRREPEWLRPKVIRYAVEPRLSNRSNLRSSAPPALWAKRPKAAVFPA